VKQSVAVLVDALTLDLRYALRQLLKTPIFLAVAVASLALGIGANTAIFTLIDGVMLQSLPVHDPDKLVLFYDGINTGVYSGNCCGRDIFSYPSWEYLKTHNDSFERLSAFRQSVDRVTMQLEGTAQDGPLEFSTAHLVSGNYFDVLGVAAAAGRVLRPEDDERSAPPVAVLSHTFWQSRFQLDGSIIGKVVVLNGTAFTIAGVAAREFFGERVQEAPDFWVPLSFQAQILQRESWLNARDVYWLNMMGRLKSGVTIRTADADVNVRLQQFYMEQAGAHISDAETRKIRAVQVALKPGGSGISGLRYRYSEPLHVLMAVVGIVLLIACANVATLLLARASTRRQEFLARIALGASPARVLRQVLTECILLSVMSGIAGVAFAWWSVKALLYLFHVSPVVKVGPNPIVLSFTFGISIVTGIVFGIIPAVRCSRIEPRSGVAVRSPEYRRSHYGSPQALIVLQVALSVVLLTGAGLLAHSLLALERQAIGFTRSNVLLVRTDPRLGGYKESELFALYKALDERMNALPGVISASIARYTPESGSSSSGNFTIQGYTPPANKEMNLHYVEVTPRFFETLRIPVLLGRTIGPHDTAASMPVAVVNEEFVRTYSPDENPIGRRISLGAPFKAPGFEIVGVVRNSKYFDLRENPKPMAFFSLWQPQNFPYAGDLLIRTREDTAGFAAAVRQALHQVNSRLPVLDVTAINQQVEHTLYQQKLITGLCGVFGGLALLLAVIGIFGTMTYSVARRTTEIGIRMAIGAQTSNVLWMILRDSLVLIAAGLLCGIPLALAAAQSIKSFLYEVPALDPIAIGTAALLIATLAGLAGYLPARRATRIDPMLAVRYE
jgi:predicted permease